MIVCIAEKPSVAGEIAKVLGANRRNDGYYEGNGYQVTWTFGHLCHLREPDGYPYEWKKWSMDVLPMVPPKYEVDVMQDPGVKKQFNTIKKLYASAEYIINCGDAGQEGELIQRWVMKLAGVRCPVKRLWISSLTEDAIKEGFRNLRNQSDFDSLYMAGMARAEGDWLLGMNGTRLYTLKYSGSRQVLSIGRVQTPTLAMIVARDMEIENFKPSPYWVLTTKYRNTLFCCVDGRFETEEKGRIFLEKARKENFLIKDIQQKRGSEQPPQLYDLTALQVDCNKKYGFSADTTLKNIQSLYEKKLTTYPRVDTKFLTDDIYGKCPGIINSLSRFYDVAERINGSHLPKSKRVFDNSKVTDHHAIIPTGDVSNLSGVNDYERKVYELIVRRFCAVFYSNCEYAQTTVLGLAGGVEFKVTGRTILSEGWRYVYKKQTNTEEESAEKEPGENEVLPNFIKGESGCHYPNLERKMTTPPKRYTEASLLQAMETAGKMVEDETLREAMKENGIGRPSSRAGIIEILIKRAYIKREKKALISTSIGRDLINIIEAKMLKSPELTGQWEKKLRDIEHGLFTLDEFMDQLEAQLNNIIIRVKADDSNKRIFNSAAPSTQGGYSNGNKSVSGRTTRRASTSVQGGKKTKQDGEVQRIYSSVTVKEGDTCPICKKGIVRKGPYGLFCSEYKKYGCRLKNK